MRRLFSCFLTWFLLVSPGGMTGSVTWADSPAAILGRPIPRRRPLPLCRTIRKSFWNAVSNRNGRGTGRRPSRPITRPSSAGRAARDFGRRLRLCEIHFKLNRRYSDASFRNVLLRLPHEQAADLYDEVLDRIQTNYVDAVPLEPLVRHGLDNLEVALREPSFVKTNAPAATPERVTWLRDALREYRAQLAIPDRASAIRMALASQRAGAAGDRHVVHSRISGIHLRRVRRPGRLHQLPDTRQAGRPLRHDRR